MLSIICCAIIYLFFSIIKKLKKEKHESGECFLEASLKANIKTCDKNYIGPSSFTAWVKDSAGNEIEYKN